MAASIRAKVNSDASLRISADFPLLGKEDQGKNCKESSKVSVRPERARAILKNGDSNIHPFSVPRKQFIKDIFTTLVDLQWRWTLSVFALGFFLSWTFFALCWYLVLYIHGDFEPEHLPQNQRANEWTPCVTEMYGFLSCFLFSAETQHTTGYGIKAPTDACVDAILLMCVQNIVGLIIEAFLVGVVFAKLTRPKLRTQTLKFSKCAVICRKDDEMYFMFRVGDMRHKSRIIETKIKSQLIYTSVIKEGESLSNHMKKLDITVDDCEGDFFLIWPLTVMHKIDEQSPFYNMSASDLSKAIFEVVVTLEGTIESTDQKTQARTSYLPDEIIWGHRFEPMVSVSAEKSGYSIDYSRFDNLVSTDTPICSVAQLKELFLGGKVATENSINIPRKLS